MPLIPEGLIDEIQVRADIAEVIGRYVPLKRAGRHFKAQCPFHKERTPSFMVNTDKQLFHCFGCGTGGNIFSFLMRHDRLTFPEAVQQLADQVGIRIPDRPAAEPATERSREVIASLTENACRFFERTLLTGADGKIGRAYVAQRGVSEATRRTFRIGLAPVGWDHLLAAARAKGVAVAPLEAAGLIIKGKSGGYYDRFRHRVMFPIQDVRGRVVGFGGRSLEAQQEPKYLNSPETALYSKGRQLFGLAQAREAIVSTQLAVVVEGYFDCAVLSDAGLTHVVSPLGTALTVDQARLLKRYAQRVILAFDADAAGEEATRRGIEVLIECGLQVRVAQLPQGIDPDEYVRTQGRDQFERLLEQSLGVVELLVQSALRRYPGHTSEDKVQAAQFVLPTVAKIPDAMLRSEYVRRLAEAFHLDERAVTIELAKAAPRSALVREPLDPQGDGLAGVTQGPERLLAALVLDAPSRWAQARLASDELSDPIVQRILSVVSELGAVGRSPTPAQVASRLSTEGQDGVVAALAELAETIPAKEAAFQDCLRRLRAGARKRTMAQLREQIRTAQREGRETDVQRLLATYQQHLSAAPGTSRFLEMEGRGI